MNKIKLFLKKYWLFILLAAMATTLIFFYFKNKENIPGEKLLPIPPQKIDSYQTQAVINYSSLENKLDNLQTEADVFQVSPLIYSDQEIIEIARKLSFNDPPIVFQDQENNSHIYNWDNEEKSLEINLAFNQIIYHLKNPNLQQTNLENLSFNESENLAYEFLSSINLLPPEEINLKREGISYIKSLENGFKQVTSVEEADLIKIDFGYYLNQTEIDGPFITLFLNGNKQITDFNYQTSFKKIELLDKYPLKTKEEIKRNLKTIESINYLSLPNSYGPTEADSENITNIYLDNIKIVYYKNIYTQSYLQPFFFINGQAILKDGTQAEVGLYLPAIKDDYLLK